MTGQVTRVNTATFMLLDALSDESTMSLLGTIYITAF